MPYQCTRQGKGWMYTGGERSALQCAAAGDTLKGAGPCTVPSLGARNQRGRLLLQGCCYRRYEGVVKAIQGCQSHAPPLLRTCTRNTPQALTCEQHCFLAAPHRQQPPQGLGGRHRYGDVGRARSLLLPRPHHVLVQPGLSIHLRQCAVDDARCEGNGTLQDRNANRRLRGSLGVPRRVFGCEVIEPLGGIHIKGRYAMSPSGRLTARTERRA